MADYSGFLGMNDEELRKKIAAQTRASLLSPQEATAIKPDVGITPTLASPQPSLTGEVNNNRASIFDTKTDAQIGQMPSKVYHPDDMGAFKPNNQEALTGPFLKQGTGGRFNEVGMNDLSSINEQPPTGFTTDVIRGNQTSRYGFDNGNVAPLELSKQEQLENRTNRDNDLMYQALHSRPDETTSKTWDAKTGRLTGENTSSKSNLAANLQQAQGYRNPEIVADTSIATDKLTNETSARNTDATNKMHIQTTGMNNATSIKTTGMNNATSRGNAQLAHSGVSNGNGATAAERKELAAGVDKWVKSTSDDLQEQYDLASADAPKTGTKEDLAYQEKLLRIKNLRANLTDFLTKGKDAARQGIDLTGDFDIYKDRYINNPELLRNNAGRQQAAGGNGKKKKTLVYNPAKGSFE